MWCWYRQVTLTANAVYFLIAWPGGVREGRAAVAPLRDAPRRVVICPYLKQILGLILKILL